MRNVIYWDELNDIYVLKMDPLTPPSAYVKIFKGFDDGICRETWTIHHLPGNYISMAFTKKDYEEKYLLWLIRKTICESHHVKYEHLNKLIRVELPPETFDAIVKYLEEGE